MAFTEEKVYSFHEYIERLEEIGNQNILKPNIPPILWARGHRKSDWNLYPTLFRTVKLGQISGKGSGRAVEEEVRRQNYIAKNYHFLQKGPENDLEWKEVMQHHGVKTRMLDWSESMLHPLIFALECFFNEKEFRTDERLQSSPCVWVLQPVDWNKEALTLLLQNKVLIDEYLKSLEDPLNTPSKRALRTRLSNLATDFNDYMAMETAPHLKWIFNFSSIMEMFRSMDRASLIYHLTRGELYYCIFHLLMFAYMNTKPLQLQDVLPYSIVESYHSPRIQAQQGVFSIFPYYEETPYIISAHNMNMYPDAMENMGKGNKWLHKILLCDPDKIAFEVMNAGMNISWLYPEMPIVANAIENRKVII